MIQQTSYFVHIQTKNTELHFLRNAALYFRKLNVFIFFFHINLLSMRV